MKYRVFDVIELNNGDKATILDIVSKDTYKVEVVNKSGISQGVMKINSKEIVNIVMKSKFYS